MIDVKIESSECKVEESKYPYIGIHKRTGLIVVFTEKDGGISLTNDGMFRERRFYEEGFTRFQGQITLSNK